MLSNLACYGTETSLFQCSHSQPNCGHSEDVGVVCKGMLYTRGGPTSITSSTFQEHHHVTNTIVNSTKFRAEPYLGRESNESLYYACLFLYD